MDEINFPCDSLFCVTLFVLCEYAVSFSSISDNGREKESHPDLLFWILLERILYHSFTSFRNISFQAVLFTTGSSLRYHCHESMFASLFRNESLLYTTNKKKSREVFLSNDNFLHFSYNSACFCGSNYLPSVQQTKQEW